MHHDLQVSIAKELLRQLDEDENVDAGVQYRMPTNSYACPELADKEWTSFFREHPQLIGLSGDLPEPGSFFTIDDFGIPVLATRDKQGEFHAFLNACPHRGARVANEQRGKRPVFVCPFHSWSFSPKGDLLAVPEMDHFGAIDKACHGLVALPTIERDGLLWVHPQPDGKLNIDELLGPLADELASHNIARLSFAADKTIDMRLNWKLANDTFGETYHFAKLHKDTLGQTFYGSNLAYEEMGQNHRFVTARKSIDVLRDQPESEWQLLEAALVIYYLFPNIQLVVDDNRVTLVRIYPDKENPGRSVTRINIYFDPEYIEKMDALADDLKITAETVYDSDRLGKPLTPDAVLEVFSSTVEEEDYVMGEHQQKTAQSGLLSHSIFGRNEAPLHHFHNNFRSALGMAPLERVE
ncbi:aromatic ring-hydroxylating oxygenase subunit alpha [Parasphingorhabdus sp.]|uniref:aromatic ring-hydroxylating oxygenase subunit alpha n=1 Tax=Parasphingorhabdus sp. TaxID=2709688 RepID=UPI003BAEA818